MVIKELDYNKFSLAPWKFKLIQSLEAENLAEFDLPINI